MKRDNRIRGATLKQVVGFSWLGFQGKSLCICVIAIVFFSVLRICVCIALL
jgi:hypothetical protein